MTSRRFEICCCVTNVAAGLWGYFYPRPYGPCIAVLIALPWLSILASRLIPSSDALAYTLLAPIAALAARAVGDIDQQAVGRTVSFGCGVAMLFAAFVFLGDRNAWRRYGLAPFIFGLFYGAGAIAEANMLLDSSTTKHFTAPVVSRDYFIGRHSTFDVFLGPWGDRHRPNKNSVSLNTYVALRGASVACVSLGRGAFGITWSRISACEDKSN